MDRATVEDEDEEGDDVDRPTVDEDEDTPAEVLDEESDEPPLEELDELLSPSVTNSLGSEVTSA